MKTGTADAEATWFHSLVLSHTPNCLKENADGIRQDWPRIPLPGSRELLSASTNLGQRISALLDTENPVTGVSSGNIRTELKLIGLPTRADGGHLKDSELALTAGWGHAGKGGGITMPDKGKLVERPLPRGRVQVHR
jgi:hypothetical protein